ncbi:lysis protein [Pantoea sp. Bo_2]|uniref:lysis protein n=1 Tax=unclassified Pantoea TaxID=2630326 RepID=UPI001232737D|nr:MULTISPECIES: lysis protein [unclassified Pantoea]KAA5938651.1 lysis protein [Pantoea sp. VH_3]KAA5946825.1 lysis protein [Pantoea sp. VH_25]KAA5977618.1 lysis protein [Pantoea sp. M_3]KAA6041341.1 lysis protein [Pantoea sp. FN_2b]KAA6045697.1 lysis protein [Pantoea sp. Bo_5]
MGIKFCLAGGVIIAMLVLGWTADHYHDKAIAWRDTAHQSGQLARRQAVTIIDMNQRQQQLAALDKTHTEALASAQHQINDLQRDVDAGRQRLQLHADCPAVPAGKSSGTARMADAARARLTDAARRDYFTLRQRIETARQQITGLQDYIRQQCLK